MFALWVLLTVVMQITIHYKAMSASEDNNWIAAIIKNCREIKQDDPTMTDESIWDHLRLNEMFFRKMYITSGEIVSIVGAYYGICFDVIFLGGTP